MKLTRDRIGIAFAVAVIVGLVVASIGSLGFTAAGYDADGGTLLAAVSGTLSGVLAMIWLGRHPLD